MSETLRRGLRGGKPVLAAVLFVLGVLLVGRLAADLYVEFLWFQSEGYRSVLTTRLGWLWGLRVLVGTLVGALVMVNLRVAARTLAGVRIRRRFGDLEIAEQLPEAYVRWTILVLAALLGLWFAASVAPGSETRLLLLFHGGEWGTSDTYMGRDIGFHVFVIPALRGALNFLLILAVFLLVLSAGAYAATGSLRLSRGRLDLPPLPRVHLAYLGAGFLALLAARFWLARYHLLLDGTSGVQGIFGFADHRARMPALQALSALTLLSAFLLVRGAIQRRLAPAVAGVIAVAMGAVLIAEGYPAVIQRFQVEPNELVRETPYIEANLEATRAAFGLDRMSRQSFPSRPMTAQRWSEAAQALLDLPVWTREALLTGLRQTEARFRYYDFHEVAVDRYRETDGSPVPVAVAVREVDPGAIEDPNWQNRHLRERYLAGMGAVAVRANGMTPGGRPSMLLSNIPPEFTGGDAPPELRLMQPSVFVGTRPQLYAVVNPSEEDFLSPDGSPGEAGVDFPRGILLSSPLRTLALAWRFQDANLLFSSEVTSASRFVHHRQVHARLQTVAPFLHFPEPPYPVISEGRVFWIVEGYSVSRDYPVASTQPWVGGQQVSWVRNSVKAVVDGVTGEMRFYRTGEVDPLADAFGRAFPGLFTPWEELPVGLVAHMRYPRLLMELQSRVLATYHQATAPLFHGQQDRWSVATEFAEGTRQVPYVPEYALVTLPGDQEPSFLLTHLMVPAGRQNLASFVMGRWGEAGNPELFLFDVPVDQQIAGPRQVETLVEQDPEISQQFSLWRQSGSQVWTGHLHLVPVGPSLLYMEPVYLAADQNAIPEIRRFVVSDGGRVVMAPSMEEALSRLSAGAGTPIVEEPMDGDVAAEPAPPPADRPVLPDASVRALELLDQAERSLREGNWAGFGEALRSLREELERIRRTEPGL